MIRFFKKYQKTYFIFFLGIITSNFAVAHSNEPILEAENYSTSNKTNNYTCIPEVCESCGTFEWSATLLFLKPNVDDTHYVLSSFDNTFNGSLYPNGKRHQNTTSFTPGFRVEGLYDICPDTSSLDLRFTYFDAHSTNSVSGGFLYDTNGFPGFGAQDSPVYAGTARSKNSYNFYSGDLTYNRSWRFFPDNLIFIVGLHGAYVKFKEHTTSTGTFINDDVPTPLSNNLNRNSHFYGLGPQLGLDYQFLLPESCCLPGIWALNAKARGSLLCGNTRSDLSYVTLRTGPGGVAVKNGDLWRVIPAASTELSFTYTLRCNCFIELGYEFMWYSRCVNKITGIETAFAGDTIDVFNNFSLHGPYLRISSAF